ncbi:MAG: ABC transporter ATP-binding protein [Thermonemataceae bacterium]
MSETAILQVEHLTKTYHTQGEALNVLKDIHFQVQKGETLALVGASGSGKTTLLGLCAGLDQPSSGQVVLHYTALDQLTEDQRARLRNEHVGFIFQNFQLLPTLTALENVMVPLELLGHKKVQPLAAELLERVGLGDRLKHYPSQLSGGEQQRVALARAFINTPKIIFADEPTGNLDEATSQKIEQLLFDMNQEHQTTLVIVTHDQTLARKTQRIIQLKGGKIGSDQPNPTTTA